MSVVVPSLRPAIAVPGWAKNELWRKAKAVPSLDLRFADSKSLVDATTGQNLVTFSRASVGTYVDSQGVLRTALVDEPRFDHDPTTGQSLGLLVEESRTNLLLRSEEFDNASWSKIACSVTPNTHSSPTGLTTADKIVEDSTLAQRYVAQTAAVAAGAQTISFYAKPDGRTVAIFYSDNGNTAQGFVLTGNGSLQGNFGASVPTSATIQAVGNGWYRCSVTWTTTAGSAQIRIYPGANTSNVVYQGDGTSGLYLWGAQLEKGSFPTSYIKNVDTPGGVTRAADVAIISGSNFSSWYRQDEGTFYSVSETLAGVTATNRFIHEVNNGVTSTGDKWDVRRTGSTAVRTTSRIGGVATADRTESLTSSVFRVAAGASGSSVSLAVNGGAITPAANTVGAMPTVTQMQLANGIDAPTLHLNGRLRRLTYWPARLANSTLQAITQ